MMKSESGAAAALTRDGGVGVDARPLDPLDPLSPLGRSVLQPTASSGVFASTAPFEDVIEALAALITRHREPSTEVLRFPPVMNRRQVEKSGQGNYPG